jgi:hypothetical protein
MKMKNSTENNSLEVRISALTSTSDLEAAGRTLDATQALTLLNLTLQGKTGLREKLNPLFVGMQSAVFRNMLASCSGEQLTLLQQEAMSEAVPHHLTLLAHALEGESKAWNTSLTLLEIEISSLPSEPQEPSDIAKISMVIDSLQAAGEQMFELLKRALALGWNTERADLIEHLSRLKEQCQKTRVFYFENGTNLKAVLTAKLNALFDESMRDEEPAIEALVRFSIWYPKDYWEIGLLPEIAAADQLEPAGQSEEQRLAHRNQLYQKASQNLEQLGLKTLSDLKRQLIYSKTALRNFLKKKGQQQ